MTKTFAKNQLRRAAIEIVNGTVTYSCCAIVSRIRHKPDNSLHILRKQYAQFMGFYGDEVQRFDIDLRGNHGQAQLARSLALLFFRESL